MEEVEEIKLKKTILRTTTRMRTAHGNWSHNLSSGRGRELDPLRPSRKSGLESIAHKRGSNSTPSIRRTLSMG
jgi:hypothetical protein